MIGCRANMLFNVEWCGVSKERLVSKDSQREMKNDTIRRTLTNGGCFPLPYSYWGFKAAAMFRRGS